MKITKLETTLFEYKLDRSMGDANSPMGRKRASGCILELTTDEGISGISIGGQNSLPQINSIFDGILLNNDPKAIFSIWKRMVEKYFKGGHDGIANDAIAAIDVALWDLKAKINEEPLWKTLGGNNNKVNVYASDIALPISDDELFNWYSKMSDKFGFKGGKLKVGLDQESDLKRLELMHNALSKNCDDPILYVDSNEYWSPKQTIRNVSEMEERFTLGWIEEPARRWDFLGLKKVSDSLQTPVCAGENLDTLGDFLPYFHHRSADVIQVSHGMTGISGALQIADAAYALELPVTLGGSSGIIHAHIANAIPNCITVEVPHPEPETKVFTSDVTIKDGYAFVGNKPGLGIEVNYEELAKHKVENVSQKAGPSPYGRRPGAGLYEIPPTKEEISEGQSK